MDMTLVTNMIDKYLDDKKLAWAPTTLKSERHRLTAAAPHLDGNPDTLWAALANHGAYGRLTIWTRVIGFWQWMQDEGVVQANPYRRFKQKNARQFKHVYTPKKPEISYAEAKARLETLPEDSRRACLRLLETGMRVSEPKTLGSDGYVVGKGAKPRKVFSSCNSLHHSTDSDPSYQKLRRHLARVGLKPHDLRKLFLSRLVELGANEFQLCEVAGWSSIQTASSYIKTNAEHTKRLVEMVQGGTAHVAKVEIP